MSLNLYVALERETQNVDPNERDHILVATYSDRLDEVAKDNKIRPLSSYFSYDPTEVEGFADDFAIDLHEFPMPPVQWFGSAEVAQAVEDLITSLENDPSAFLRTKIEGRLDELIAELRHISAIAQAASEANIGIRLWVGE